MVELRRWLYRGGRPNRVARAADRLTATLAARGRGPDYLVTLEVPGRRSGRTVGVPLVMAEVGGERYLVSMLGEGVNWVRNVRAAGGEALLRHGRREEVRLEEVAPERRAPVLKARAGRAAVPRLPGGAKGHMRRTVLLGCGVISSLLYVAANVRGARRWREYSLASQTVSELSAIGAPSRPFVIPLLAAHGALVIPVRIGCLRVGWSKPGAARHGSPARGTRGQRPARAALPDAST
jgi:hypothetical protein